MTGEGELRVLKTEERMTRKAEQKHERFKELFLGRPICEFPQNIVQKTPSLIPMHINKVQVQT